MTTITLIDNYRQLHLESGALPRCARRGGQRLSQRQGERRGGDRGRARRDRTVARPLQAHRRPASASISSTPLRRPYRSSAFALAIRRLDRRTAARWCARQCRCMARSPPSNTKARRCFTGSMGHFAQRAIIRSSSTRAAPPDLKITATADGLVMGFRTGASPRMACNSTPRASHRSMGC